MLRAAGFLLIACPSVALAQLVLTGTVPPPLVLLGVALVAGLIGLATASSGPGSTSGHRLAAQLAAAQLAGHALVYLALGQPSSGCLPVMGRGAVAGLRLAILRPDAACAPGQYTAGPVLTATFAVLLSGAAVLLWQVLAAAAGSALLGMAARAWTATQALAALAALAVLSLSRAFEPLLIEAAPRQAPSVAAAGMPRRVVTGSLLRRGPPVLASF